LILSLLISRARLNQNAPGRSYRRAALYPSSTEYVLAQEVPNTYFCRSGLKAPARNTNVVIAADLMTFTKVWLGYVGLAAALENGKVSLSGPSRAISAARRLLALPSQPTPKTFRFSAFPTGDTFAA
jgi:hypothetical protein